jgi:uncharacterized protein (TIGR02271 family)
MAAKKDKAKDPEKTVDLPPHGSRNPDPVSDQPGSHPIETGIGAVLGGAASGLAVGALASGPAAPIGAVIGAIAGGAVAGGLAGKGVGELLDPTTEDNWIREYLASEEAKKHARPGDTHETYRSAYRYGTSAGGQYAGQRFDEVESHLQAGWERDHAASGLAWGQARGAVKDAFDRTIRLHEERLKVDKTREKTGEVEVRKEVKTEHKQITVPVAREEVVIERRAVNERTGGAVKAEEIRIPVSEEKVKVSKETVVKEEVSVGKRKVTDTETVEADVRREELEVEQEGKVNVRQDKKK